MANSKRDWHHIGELVLLWLWLFVLALFEFDFVMCVIRLLEGAL